MNKFMSAMKSYDTLTENGAVAHSTSGSELVDFLYAIGSVRNNPRLAVQSFHAAADVNRLAALKILFHMRNPRGGQGEREATRAVLRDLAKRPEFYDDMRYNMHLIPHYGRWDDLLVFYGTPLWDDATRIIGTALSLEDCYLVAKWMPRKGPIADALRHSMGLSQKGWRKLLSSAPTTVERQMSAKAFSEIDYNGVPSRASKIYRRAFMRNDTTRYSAWCEGLASGTSKVNSATLYPHEIVMNYMNRRFLTGGDDGLFDAMWAALPNWVEPGKSIIPLCDVSGSMYTTLYKSKATALDVSVSLGIYLAERNVGPWKDQLISFTSEPRFFSLRGQSLRDKVVEVTSNAGYDTDFLKVFKVILQRATELNLSQEDMPDTIVAFSDMQFNDCESRRISSQNDSRRKTVWENAKRLYEGTGFRPPQMIFWNICSPTMSLPARADECGIALVGGFSPSLLKAVTTGKVSPDAMLDAAVLKNPLYDPVKVVLETIED